MKIHWVLLPDQDRAYYFKFCLMEYVKNQSEVSLDFVNPNFLVNFDLKPNIVSKLSKHSILIIVENNSSTLKVVIDNEDGFHEIAEIIEDADVYFKGAYNSRLFCEYKFPEAYEWQKGKVQDYEDRFEFTLEKYKAFFSKICPFIPMAMDMNIRGFGLSRLYQKVHNSILDKVTEKYICFTHFLLKLRYEQVLSYRDLDNTHDVAAHDTLWGWPRNRYLLHLELEKLANDKVVSHSLFGDLAYQDFWKEHLHQEEIKQMENWNSQLSKIRNIEQNLCSATWNVFASGKHWGWRQIMFVRLASGKPVFMDKPLYEAYFDFDEFPIVYKKHSWSEIGEVIHSTTIEKVKEIKEKQIEVFNKRLAPDAVASFFINHKSLTEIYLDT